AMELAGKSNHLIARRIGAQPDKPLLLARARLLRAGLHFFVRPQGGFALRLEPLGVRRLRPALLLFALRKHEAFRPLLLCARFSLLLRPRFGLLLRPRFGLLRRARSGVALRTGFRFLLRFDPFRLGGLPALLLLT